jgi:LPXTG-motif cell wall-anchored protein
MGGPTAASTTTRVSIDLGWRAKTRPPSAVAHVLAAGAGAFAVFATVALALEITSTNATAPGILLDLALAGVAFVAGLVLPGPVRSAAVVALVFTNPLIWFFAFYGNGQSGSGGLRGIYLLSIAVYLVLYVVKWTRGRAVLLAGLLLFLASWLQFEIGASASTVVPLQSQFQSSPFGTHVSTSSSGLPKTGDDTATVALVVGLVFLTAAVVLDRRGLRGVALPFIAIGTLEAIAGAAVLGTNEDSAILAGLLVAVVGVVLCVIGALGENRRGSTWLGVLAIVGGVLAAIGDASHSTLGFAGYSALVGLGLLAASLILAGRLHEAPDGEPTAPA